jgi:ribosomal protein S12 methylthiotransferase accessory factor
MSSVSRYTGLFRAAGPVAIRAHDPDVAVWAGTPANRAWPAADAVGGAGWTERDAELACIGEAIERWQTHPLARDRRITTSFRRIDRPAIDPARFVRFSAEQHAQPGFPFEQLTADTDCEWVSCRTLGSGAPCWAPADLVFLDMRPGVVPRFGPTISTGWAAHADPEAAARAGVLEAIERDAVVGAWWGRYALHELPPLADERIARPNLRWRWYRIVTQYSPHVVLATVEGDDHEGHVFAIGSACRLDRRAAIDKATLEAVQGRHYARHLIATTPPGDPPRSFAEHAAFYSRCPDRLAATCLASADRMHAGEAPTDAFAAVLARLPPVAVRIATPPALVDHGYAVVRVLVPELQPLHGDHLIPFLGGPLWSRPLADWASIPPLPFA